MTDFAALTLVVAIVMIPVNFASLVIVFTFSRRRADLQVLRHTLISRLGAFLGILLVFIHEITLSGLIPWYGELVHVGVILTLSWGGVDWLYRFVRLQTTPLDGPTIDYVAADAELREHGR